MCGSVEGGRWQAKMRGVLEVAENAFNAFPVAYGRIACVSSQEAGYEGDVGRGLSAR